MITICSYAMLGNVSVHVDILSCCLPVGASGWLLPSRSTIVLPVIFASALLGAKCVLTSGTKEWMGWHRVVLFVGLRGLSPKPLCSVDWRILRDDGKQPTR